MAPILLLLSLFACTLSSQIPPLGPIQGITPLADLSKTFRHCSYVGSFDAREPSNEDFQFVLATGANNQANSFSFQSVDFPSFYIGIKNLTSGALGIISPSDEGWDAGFGASWLLSNPGPNSSFSLQSLSRDARWTNKFMTFAQSQTMPCPAQDNRDAVLGDGADAPRSTFIIGAAPPQPPASATVHVGTVYNPSVSKRWMGCHHDYGFAQAPRGFLGNLIYGSSFEAGTQGVPGWLPHQLNTSDAPPAFNDAAAFSGKPSMDFSLSHSGGENGLKNRGIGGAGLYLEGGKPYTVSLFLWTGGAPTAFVELFDFTTNTSLARQDFSVQSAGPDWGSLWVRYNFTLTPSAGTQCVGIPFNSDPTIDCGEEAGPAHVCVRCGGEFRLGISSPRDFKAGYVELMPGAWGLVQSKRGGSIPVLSSAGSVLTQLGVTTMRNGGSVSQGMRWMDWRGPVWNRASQRQVWGKSLLSGWGPFDYLELAEALDIEPILTLAYDSNSAAEWAALVEYCWGDVTTSWGALRAADRGHSGVYNVTVFELGNEQYNPAFVEQVLAMEARSQQLHTPPLRYMFPDNGGLNAGDAARLMAAAPGVVPRILPDIHIGAGGAVGEAAGLFANPPVPGFTQGAINCETNAGTHDLKRAIDEAADLIDFFGADPATTGRIYARTASFCTGSSNNFDSWDQGISFFLPNMTWLQPPGYVHQMISQTWGEQTLLLSWATPAFPLVAQMQGSKTLVLRAANPAAGKQSFIVTLQGGAVAGPLVQVWSLGGSGYSAESDNTPGNPAFVSPVQSTLPIAAGATQFNATLQPLQFCIFVMELQ